MLIVGVYTLTDKRTGKFYVGSSGDIRKRLDRHYNELQAGIHHCPNLQRLWKPNCVLLETILATETREEAYALEQDILDRYKDSETMLNIQLGVRGGDALTRHPRREEIIARIKESIKERMCGLTPLERRILFGNSGAKNGMWGKTHTTEARKRISDANKGVARRSGFTLSDEHRQVLSEHAKKRVGELNGFYGRQHSEETKQRISTIKKEQHLPPSNTRKVEVDGVVYESLTDASRKLNISPALMVYRINSDKDKYKGYCYLT